MSAARLLLIAAALCLLASFVHADRRPTPEALSPAVHAEPRQTPTDAAPFSVHAGGVDYRIVPLADYDIAGLVVSRHDSSTWWDYIHRESNDHLNVADLCLVWGANTADGAYQRMRFSSGQFVCYYQYPSDAGIGPAQVRALSNNHLLTDRPELAEAIRGLRVGDQVRLRGQLASYSHDAGMAFSRGTSLDRDDTGNGACETLFVRELQLLQPAPAWPRQLRWLGLALLALGLVAWYRAPFQRD